jgi:hypothetical protein
MPAEFTEYQGVRCALPTKVVYVDADDLVDSDDLYEVQDQDGLVMEAFSIREDAVALRNELNATPPSIEAQAEEIAERLATQVDDALVLTSPGVHLAVLANLRDRFNRSLTLAEGVPAPSPFTLVGCIVVDTDTEEG